MWGISHSRHLHYSIPMALDSIDLQNAFRMCIFIHILGYVPDGASPSSLILLCTLLSLFVGRLCFHSNRSPTISLFIVFYVIVACVYHTITNPTVPTQQQQHHVVVSPLLFRIFPLPLLPSLFFPSYPRLSRISLLFLAMDHSTLVFDTFNVDLVIKVLANTAFSPFFTGMIPVFYYFHAGTLKNDTVVSSFCYFLLVSSFCTSTVLSILLGPPVCLTIET